MQTIQQYRLSISDLFVISGGVMCGATAEVAIMDGCREVERVEFVGKIGPGGPGYSRMYSGRPGLKAKMTEGPGTISMTSI